MAADPAGLTLCLPAGIQLERSPLRNFAVTCKPGGGNSSKVDVWGPSGSPLELATPPTGGREPGPDFTTINILRRLISPRASAGS